MQQHQTFQWSWIIYFAGSWSWTNQKKFVNGQSPSNWTSIYIITTHLVLNFIQMSVPKKLNKFNNFISNSFKIKDDNASCPCTAASHVMFTWLLSCRSRSSYGNMSKKVVSRNKVSSPIRCLFWTQWIILLLHVLCFAVIVIINLQWYHVRSLI